ncbi:hypothetical protein LZ31DRAFT_381939 [Colletotrichum somersetense]|nr:hypothetical protein LZ31DRAFT_381939 [Colletotrichum somersetense]
MPRLSAELPAGVVSLVNLSNASAYTSQHDLGKPGLDHRLTSLLGTIHHPTKPAIVVDQAAPRSFLEPPRSPTVGHQEMSGVLAYRLTELVSPCLVFALLLQTIS